MDYLRTKTYDEIQALLDAADGRVEEIRNRGRKGALTAMRDSALLKTYYAYGMRRRENVGLDLADLRRNRDARPSSGRAPDLDPAARRPVTASPTAPSTVARLAAQAARA
jgi:integrase